MGEGLLVGTDGRKVKESADTFECSYEELDVISLQIIDEVLKAGDCSIVINQLKFSELADILQIAAALIVDHEIGVDIISQPFVIREERVDDAFLDVSEVDGDDGCNPAEKRCDKLVLFAVLHDIPS